MTGGVLGVIPARMASSRYPGKPLVPIHGRPMIYHVWRRARMCPLLDRVVVATDDERILNAARAFGAEALMTAGTHVRSNDRVAEVASRIPCDIVLNIQGDEPLVAPQLITDVVEEFGKDPDIQCVNPVAELASEEERRSPHTVKVAYNLKKKVVYFSRYAIPSDLVRERTVPVMRQVPILGFKAEFCVLLSRLPAGPLETQEGIDLLRAIDHDLPVHVMETSFQTVGVDTPHDRDVVEERMTHDPVFRAYSGSLS